jgi:primosomal protein N' (replication factor Y)
VTGSGKTEVYLELVTEALKSGRSALIIVPEIALTPQLIERFESRLGHKVAVLHSSIRPQARWKNWASVLSGDVRVAIGARSGIFAPMKDLGLIVVDEEHDPSFKQGEGIRYNARDLAVVRAKLCSCPIVLGSATPSLESFQHARSGKHILLSLGQRFFNSKPLSYQVVDLNKLKPWEMPSRNISPALLSALEDTLREGGQAFILYNRRGFATYLQCTKCEHVVGCPHCSVTLTFHRKTNSLLCHFCGYSTPPPVACSECGAKDTQKSEDGAEYEPLFKHRGSGTERVFEELANLLPTARIEKLDRDAVRTLDDYTAILGKVRSGSVDILVGTQMIAKGHDLPNVNFVGIVDCDVGLHVPDFRAAERAFQLLTQVSGRAGRREKQGRIILQTRVPQHASLQMTIAADYHGFASQELAMRESLGYPPFQRLLRIIVGAEERGNAERLAARIAENARASADALEVTVLGPAPAPVEKVRSFWRYHILCKAPSAAKLQHLMSHLKLETLADKGSRVVYDLDPQDML